MEMRFLWIFGTIASIYGAIAGSFLEHTYYTAVAFGLFAILFALAAYKEISSKK
jgi:hypothetical protein